MGGLGPWVSGARVGGIPQMELMGPPARISSALTCSGRVLAPKSWFSVCVSGWVVSLCFPCMCGCLLPPLTL
jgi:hypothetical protein